MCENDLTSPPTPLLKERGEIILNLWLSLSSQERETEGEVIAFNSFLRIPRDSMFIEFYRKKNTDAVGIVC